MMKTEVVSDEMPIKTAYTELNEEKKIILREAFLSVCKKTSKGYFYDRINGTTDFSDLEKNWISNELKILLKNENLIIVF